MNALNVLGLGSLIAAHDFKIDFFPFVKSFEACSKNGGVMNEHVLSGILSNETETLLVIEPFYFTTPVALGPKP